MRLLAINGVGFEDSVAGMAELGDLPLLQDTSAVNAWGAWAAVYRDVIIVDAENQRVTAYNLTTHDLAEPGNRAALKRLLLEAAGL